MKPNSLPKKATFLAAVELANLVSFRWSTNKAME